MPEVIIYLRYDEINPATIDEGDVRIKYNNQWIDFRDGEVIITPEKRQLNTEKPFGGFV